MVQQDEPDDYLLATGKCYSVRDFVERAFLEVNRRIEWRGQGVDEIGVDSNTGTVLIRIDSRYFRPTEVDLLLGDASKAGAKLGWKHRTSFDELVHEMVAADLKWVREHGKMEGAHG